MPPAATAGRQPPRSGQFWLRSGRRSPAARPPAHVRGPIAASRARRGAAPPKRPGRPRRAAHRAPSLHLPARPALPQPRRASAAPESEARSGAARRAAGRACWHHPTRSMSFGSGRSGTWKRRAENKTSGVAKPAPPLMVSFRSDRRKVHAVRVVSPVARASHEADAEAAAVPRVQGRDCLHQGA
eukprot:scaffold5297_cov110-Isochrysis_galbana.AAC.7